MHPNDTNHCDARGVETSNQFEAPSTQVDAPINQVDAPSNQNDVDDGQQAERVPSNSAMGGGNQRVGGDDDTAESPLMGGANAVVGLDNNEEEQSLPGDSEADVGVGSGDELELETTEEKGGVCNSM